LTSDFLRCRNGLAAAAGVALLQVVVAAPALANTVESVSAPILRVSDPAALRPSTQHDGNFGELFGQWQASDAAANSSAARITVSRASDMVGVPIDYSREARARYSASQGLGKGKLSGISIPSRMHVAATALTSTFGPRWHPVLGMVRGHSGIDLAAPMGSPIVATSDGVVGEADWRGGYGLFVAIQHGGGIETRYGHMSRIAVAPGQQVRKGDVIGYVGSPGLSTGPHLHYEVRVNGQAVNPAPLLRGR